jgi:hypothetical protein
MAAVDDVDDPLGPSHYDRDDRIVVPVDVHRPPASASAVAAASTIALLAMMTVPSAAHAAAGPDWGIFEGRTGSLLHPVAMLSMFALSTSTAYLGYQWRRQRTLGDEISTLKKSLPNLMGADTASSALKIAMEAEAIDQKYVDSLKMALETERQVADLTKERKELASSNPRDKHFNQGALLLFVGTAFAIEVCSCFCAARVVVLVTPFISSPSFPTCRNSTHPPPTLRILCTFITPENASNNIYVGTAQHLRTSREALPRTAPVRRGRTRRALVPRGGDGTAHAKGERPR